jgi:hypothetical protein
MTLLPSDELNPSITFIYYKVGERGLSFSTSSRNTADFYIDEKARGTFDFFLTPFRFQA